MEKYDSTGSVRAKIIPQYSQPKEFKAWRIQLDVLVLGEWARVGTPDMRWNTLADALTAAQTMADSGGNIH